jgi:hypothetical protein
MIDLKELDNDPWPTFPAKKEDLRALVAAVMWQPIETAPKDGTLILACLGKTMKIVVWYPVLKEWGNPQEWGDDGTWKPTHWMSLPEPPKGEGL